MITTFLLLSIFCVYMCGAACIDFHHRKLRTAAHAIIAFGAVALFTAFMVGISIQ